jgi:hypothetical protein
MALGRKTGGRKAGTPNKIRPPKFKERMLEAQAEALARVEAITKQLPLEFLLEVMRDESYPPGARIEAAKAAALLPRQDGRTAQRGGAADHRDPACDRQRQDGSRL